MSASRTSERRFGPRPQESLERVFHEHVGFVWGALTNIVTTTIAFSIAPYAQLAHLMIIHLLGAVLISTRYGMVVATFTAVTGAAAFDYFCVPPVFAFAVPDPHSVVIFAGMMAVALLVCWLNQGLRVQRAAARASEARTQMLCELSLDLSRVSSKQELSDRARQHLERLFGPQTRLVLGAAADERAGLEVQLVGDAEAKLGYIQVHRARSRDGSAREQRLLLVACADRVADAIERVALGEAAQRALVEAEMERHRNALLSAVSHDMKTPLASILTAGTSLLNATKPDSTGPARELLETIVQEAERMNALITNLLCVTRLEAGNMPVSRELEGLDDLIFGVLARFSGRLEGRAVAVDVPHDLPLVALDPGLIDLMLVNLLENVMRYTPAASPIDIRVARLARVVAVEVCDRGPGIAADEREKVFDKFYRGRDAKRNDGGTGLGLTICRAVARAHDGEVRVLERDGGGSVVRFSLPYSDIVPEAPDVIVRRTNT
jgi:two-component system sensor histidine kinase KdpD